MLELYNHDMSVCAAKVRFAMAEKELEYTSHMVNLLAREHKTPEYLALNPNGVVPTWCMTVMSFTNPILLMSTWKTSFPRSH